MQHITNCFANLVVIVDVPIDMLNEHGEAIIIIQFQFIDSIYSLILPFRPLIIGVIHRFN